MVVKKLLLQLLKIAKPQIEFYTFPGNYFRGTLINIIDDRIFHLRNIDVLSLDSEDILEHIKETMINVDKIESVTVLFRNIYWNIYYDYLQRLL